MSGQVGYKPTRCFVATFGCRVNQADSEGILGTLEGDLGMEATGDHHDADVVVINSCTVTHRSDADIRKLVNRVHRDNPDAKVVVTGCYAQRDPDALVRLPGTSAVVGHSDRGRLGEVVHGLLTDETTTPIVVRTPMDALDPADLPPVEPVAVVHDRTRPFVKIQDGCDARCTYCIIPSVRGGARSAPASGVVDAVRTLVDRGYFEVVLAGVHLGTYDGGATLSSLVRRVLDEVDGLGRLRLSCIEPMAFPIELADIARDQPRLAPHFHLPLQSGSDRVLKRMARPYTAAAFCAIIDAIRARVPGACLGTDIIVGFPGETDADFEASCAVARDAGLDYLHVFSYSDRPGVPATRLKDKVDPRIIKARVRSLIEIGEGRWAQFLDRQVGRTLDALMLEGNEALSDNYCPIFMDDPLAANTPVRAQIIHREGSKLRGRAMPADHRSAAAAPAVVR